MPLGAELWIANKSFYDGLTLARDGVAEEQEFASRHALASEFPNYERFWKLHVCPATNRPHDAGFRTKTSAMVRTIAKASFAVLVKLLDADDSLATILAGDLGDRNRNARDTIEAAGNALQLASELCYAVGGNPNKPKLPSLARELSVPIDLFPDWDADWKVDRDNASEYRHALVHDGLPYTVNIAATGEVLVLGRASFKPGINWEPAQASYTASPGDWQPLGTVCTEIFRDTVAFINRTYERLLSTMQPLLTNPAYQQAWGWDDSTTTVKRPPMPAVNSTLQIGSSSITVMQFTVPPGPSRRPEEPETR
jgi:hypothetical protein